MSGDIFYIASVPEVFRKPSLHKNWRLPERANKLMAVKYRFNDL
jgi:hypothetical protein